MVEHRPILEGILQAMNTNDYSVYHRYFTDDYVDEIPQSGEQIRGQANARWILENYPGAGDLKRGLDLGAMRSQASDEIKIVAPTFSIVKLEGRGNEGTAAFRGRYPDGSVWVDHHPLPVAWRSHLQVDDVLCARVSGAGVARRARRANARSLEHALPDGESHNHRDHQQHQENLEQDLRGPRAGG